MSEEFNKDIEKTESEAPETPVEAAAEEAAEPTPEEIAAAKKAELGKTVKKELKGWGIALLQAVAIVLVIRFFFFTIIRVDGDSMYPTLQNNERLFVTVLDAKWLGQINRDDIVICHYPDRGWTNFVKRVVGVPGDKVSRKDGVTYVNGEALDPKGLYYQVGNDYDEYTLGENEYFVVGDNRYNSHDSRDWNDRDSSNDVGPITKDMIVGKVRQVIWPLSSFRSVD